MCLSVIKLLTKWHTQLFMPLLGPSEKHSCIDFDICGAGLHSSNCAVIVQRERLMCLIRHWTKGKHQLQTQIRGDDNIVILHFLLLMPKSWM